MAILRRLTAVMMTLAILTACTPSPTSVTVTSAPVVVSASPTYLCTPTPSATPTACDKATYDKEQQQRALEAEAIAVYQRYWKEYTRLLEAGGATEATPELKATATGTFLGNVVALLKYQKDKGWLPRPLIITQRNRITATPTKSDAEVSLIACEDARGTILVDSSGKESGKGVLAVQVLALRRTDGVMKIFDSTSDSGAACPIA